MSSAMMTASQPLGRGSPVSTGTYSPSDSVTGVVSVAPKLLAASSATPSIAQAW